MGKPITITSFILIGIGVLLFTLNILLDGALNIALPLVFLVLAGIFFIVTFATREKWKWASLLFIPGALLAAFGVIFLLNVVTNDWKSWAYAWLLLVAGIGVGMGLASRAQPWHPWVARTGWGLALGGITFFCVFGAIAGGLFIQIMAPILLVIAGVSLRWLPWDSILPDSFRRRQQLTTINGKENPEPPNRSSLVEPLSSRELEVLALVDAGFSNQEIAAKLNIAASTVKTHINNIYGKLGVQTRVQAVNRARELGLLEN